MTFAASKLITHQNDSSSKKKINISSTKTHLQGPRHHSNILTEKNRLYRMFEEVFSAILAVYDVGTTKTAFHLPLEIAQTYGNDDFENNYFFVSLQPNEAPLDIRKLTFATHNPRMPLPAVATVPLSL